LSEEHTLAQTNAAVSTRKASPRRGSAKRSPKGTRPKTARRGPLTVFVHIPKTAGTTLTAVLRGNFPAGGVRALGNVFHGSGGIDPGPVAKLRKSGAVVTRDIYLLGGHLPFGVHEYLPIDSRYVTFLRDPVERTLSQYYRLLTMRKRNPVPEGMTLEDLMDSDEYLYDNLQTRMLCSRPEPFGEVTDDMLEEAKENLATKFICFGLADRFDESLVLLKRRLELRSILYVSQRMTTTRPRTEQSKEALVPVAERFNAYDIELYRWASEHFEQTIAEEDRTFAVDVAALRAAVSAGPVSEDPPAASDFSREQLWEELVRARADLLGWEYEAAKAKEEDQSQPAEQDDDLRALLTQAHQSILQLHERIEGLEGRLGPSQDSDSDEEPETEADAGERPRKRERVKAARLEHLRGQIAELETAIGDEPEETRDVHVVRELERLRAHAAEVEKQRQEPQRRSQTEEGTSKADRWLTPHQQAERVAALETARDNSAAVIARMEKRLAQIRVEIQDLEAEADGGESKERLERLRGLASGKAKRIEVLRQRLADRERRLGALAAEAETVRGPAAAEQALDQTAGGA
jgi:hypothetical protein